LWALRPAAVVPEAILIKTRRNRAIARVPLGRKVETRFGAPYWIVHRGDLQAALLDAVRAHHDIALELGVSSSFLLLVDLLPHLGRRGSNEICRRLTFRS